MEPRSRLLPEGLHFRPTDLEMAIFLKQKALGQPIEACIIPEERHDIFSIPPRDLPGQFNLHSFFVCGFGFVFLNLIEDTLSVCLLLLSFRLSRRNTLVLLLLEIYGTTRPSKSLDTVP